MQSLFHKEKIDKEHTTIAYQRILKKIDSGKHTPVHNNLTLSMQP